MKTLSIVALVCIAALCVSGFMFPEDKLPKKYWESLTAKEKHIFLMGYRTGTGPSEKVARMPEVPPGFLVLSEKHFDTIVQLVDAFYEDGDNKNVRVGGAIEIALMNMQKKSQEDISKRLKQERELIYTAF
jgi:hypothetical protein